MSAADFEQPAQLPPLGLASYDVVEMETPFGSAPAPVVGYDDGFAIASGAEHIRAEDYPFLLRINSWFQLRHTAFESETTSPDLNLLSFERLRLSFSGHACSPSLKYFCQLEGNSDQASQAIFLDYFVTYDLGHDRWCWDEGRLGLKAGKWKVPFSRSRVESGRRIQFVERSTADLFFDLNRSLGVGLFGEWGDVATPLRYETALFNGFQSGADTDIRDAGMDQNFAWSARITQDLFSEFGGDGEPDLSWHTVPTVRLGCGLAATRVDNQGLSEFSQQRVVDSGAPLASLLPASVTCYDVGLYTLDAQWKYQGLSFIAEYFWRRIINFQGDDIDNLSDQGLLLQCGQFVVPGKLELQARWSRVNGDSGTLGLMNQSTDEVAAGVAWYINGHNAKIVMDVTHLNGMPLSSPRLDVLPGAAGWLVRTQFQWGF